MKKTSVTSLILLVVLCCTFLISTAGFSVTAKADIEQNINSSTEGVIFRKSYFAEFEASIIIYDSKIDKTDQRIVAVFDEIDQMMTKMDKVANTNDPNSEISKFNDLKTGQTIEISDDFAKMMTIAKEIYSITDGAFDPTAFRLVDLWGFSPRTNSENGNLPYDRVWQSEMVHESWGSYPRFWYPLPETKFVEAFKQLCDFGSIVLEGTTSKFSLTKNCPASVVDGVVYQQWMDLGAVAKGYCVDLVEEILAKHNFDKYYINFGQSSIAFSTYEDGSEITVGLQNPDSLTEAYAFVSSKNTALGASGTYLKSYTTNGKTFSHIINPKTGYPVDQTIASITILGDGSGYADCLTTALTVLGKDGIIDFMNSQYCRQNNLKILALLKDSRHFAAKVQLLTNLDKSEFLLADGIKIATRFVSAVDSFGNTYLAVQYVETVDYSAVLLVLGLMGAVLLFSACLVKYVKNKNSQKTQKIVELKKDKFFKLGDIAVYLAVVVLIVVLIAVFVVGAKENQLETIKIENIYTGETLFSAELKSKTYTVFESEFCDTVVEQTADKIIVTLTMEIDGETHFNTLTISTKTGDLYAKMTSSQCGLHQECVKTFPSITNGNGVIVCTPNGIKVTSDVSRNYILI